MSVSPKLTHRDTYRDSSPLASGDVAVHDGEALDAVGAGQEARDMAAWDEEVRDGAVGDVGTHAVAGRETEEHDMA